MFKKPKNKKIIKKRKVEDEHDSDTDPTSSNNINDENEDDGSSSTLNTIQSVKKARRIKNLHRAQLQSAKPKKIIKPAEEEEDILLVEANQDLKQRLEGNFAVNGGSTNDEDGSILTQKHKWAMEQYIKSKMKDDDTVKPEENTNTPMDVRDTTDLYAQLLQQSAELANNNQESGVEEGDVGAGGAMLGGTGIAEVALPVEDRIKAVKETELAAARLERGRGRGKQQYNNADFSSNHPVRIEADVSQFLPMSFAQGRGKNRNRVDDSISQRPAPANPIPISIAAHTPTPNTVGGRASNKEITDIGASYAHNFRLHNEEWISNKKKLEVEKKAKATEMEENEIDSTRVGFEVKRGLKSERGADGGKGGGKKANDDRTYKKFVSRERQNNRR